MKKNLFLFFLLGGLVVLTWYIVHRSTGGEADYKFDYFTVSDTANVGKIFLVNRMGAESLLERNGNNWVYTNRKTGQKYEANPDVMKLLLKAITDVRVRMRIPRTAERNVMKALATNQTKVEIYDKQNKKLKSYYVGMRSGNQTGNDALMDGDDIPYIIFLPGFEGDMQPRFPTGDETWRDRALFRLQPQSILSVSLQYVEGDQRKMSFNINRNVNPVAVTALFPELQPEAKAPLNQDFLKRYLEGFSEVIAEADLTNDQDRDAVLGRSPVWCVMDINILGGFSKHIEFRPMDYKYAAQREDWGQNIRGKMSRYAVVIDNGKQVLLMQQPVLEKLFAGYMSFYQ